MLPVVTGMVSHILIEVLRGSVTSVTVSPPVRCRTITLCVDTVRSPPGPPGVRNRNKFITVSVPVRYFMRRFICTVCITKT